MTEEKALKELRRGSEEALAWLIDRYTAYVTTVIHHIFGEALGQEDMEEAASDVFLVLWNNAGKVRSGSVRPYLGGVARNVAKSRLRGADRSLPLEDDLILVDPSSPALELERKERDRIVRAAVLGLGEPDREIFLRHYFHAQSVAVIAEEMGLTVSGVKSRLFRGREKLRNALEADDMKSGGVENGIPCF